MKISVFISLAIVFCFMTMINACYKITNVAPGVIQLMFDDGGTHARFYYKKYDPVTQQYYLAEETDNGDYEFTTEGKKDRDLASQRQKQIEQNSGGGESGGDGEGGDGGGHP